MNKSKTTDKSRRAFLSDCGKMTAIGAMSSVLNMTMTNKILAARTSGSITDYKGLVCVFLNGGADTFQMLQPGIEGYAAYTERRQHFALNRANQHRIVDGNNKDYHLHQNMPEIADMFAAGDVSFVANVGTLVEPMTRSEYINKTKRRPNGVSSHFDQTIQWQTSISNQKGVSVGWVGRMADIINDAANNNGTVSMNLSPSGPNTLQQGANVAPLTLQGGANAMELYESDSNVRAVMDSQLEANYSSLLKQHYNHIKKGTIEQNQAIQDLERSTVINTVFPDSHLGNQLLQVAKYVKIHGVLGLNRQTFFVSVGGWDMHTGLNSRLPGKLEDVAKSLKAFNSAMKEIGHHEDVVTYTASDFGRTLGSNGSGNDHAWGSNQMVMGGPVRGGFVRGNYPDHTKGTETDLGERGKQLPQISVDEFHASLARWFGVTNDSEMEEIIPNIRNFYAAGNQTGNQYYAIPWLFKV